MTDYAPTPRTSPTRNPQRVTYDQAAVHAALDAGFLCHLGFLADDRPVVLPHLYARLGETVYVHGSSAARALLAARSDVLPVCLTVTHVDGVVFAKSAFHHSINYRSVVLHGLARAVTDDAEKRRALDAIVEAVAAGRSGQTRPPSVKELAATAVLAVPLEDVSLKARSGPPIDEPEDLALPYWAGVLPLSLVAGDAIPGPGSQPPLPGSVADWSSPAGGG
jgi:nitroimidazol reductase NimA-like FMN-containing flavoprotein (pyridoxamine 5'-phosphate oxidase superfamily)